MAHIWESLSKVQANTFLRITGMYFYNAYMSVLTELDSHWESLAQNETLLLEMYRMKGYCLMKVGQSKDALGVFSKALHLNPDHEYLRENLLSADKCCRREIEYLVEISDWEKLWEITDAYLRVFPNTPHVQWCQAMCLYSWNDARALELFTELVNRFPEEEKFIRSQILATSRFGSLNDAIYLCHQVIGQIERFGGTAVEFHGLLEWLMSHLDDETSRRDGNDKPHVTWAH